MKKVMLLIVVLVAGIIFAWILESPAYADTLLRLDNPEISQLRAEVELLKERITALEEEGMFTTIAIPANTVEDQREVPKDWEVRKFQGHEYYVVPLKFSKERPE